MSRPIRQTRGQMIWPSLNSHQSEFGYALMKSKLLAIPELLLKDANLCTDRRLVGNQSVSALNDTPCSENLGKGSGKLDARSHTSTKSHLSGNRIRLSNVLARWIVRSSLR